MRDIESLQITEDTCMQSIGLSQSIPHQFMMAKTEKSKLK